MGHEQKRKALQKRITTLGKQIQKQQNQLKIIKTFLAWKQYTKQKQWKRHVHAEENRHPHVRTHQKLPTHEKIITFKRHTN